MADMLDCNIIVSEIDLQLQSYIYFWTNALWEGMQPLISQAVS